MTDAELEKRHRRCVLNFRRIETCLSRLRKAINLTTEEKERLQKAIETANPGNRNQHVLKADALFEQAGKNVHMALAALVDPTIPGLSAEELGVRTFQSLSVHLRAGRPGNKDNVAEAGMIGWLNKDPDDGLRTVTRPAGPMADLMPFVDMSRRLSASELLEAIPADKITGLVNRMTDVALKALDDGDPSGFGKAKYVTDIVAKVLAIVEPKITVQTDTPIESMDEEETIRFLQSAQRIMQEKAHGAG